MGPENSTFQIAVSADGDRALEALTLEEPRRIRQRFGTLTPDERECAAGHRAMLSAVADPGRSDRAMRMHRWRCESGLDAFWVRRMRPVRGAVQPFLGRRAKGRIREATWVRHGEGNGIENKVTVRHGTRDSLGAQSSPWDRRPIRSVVRWLRIAKPWLVGCTRILRGSLPETRKTTGCIQPRAQSIRSRSGKPWRARDYVECRHGMAACFPPEIRRV